MPRVLLVDDEKNVLTTLSIGLRRNQYKVLQAQSGPEALRILSENPCDLVVSDIRMAPMDGITLAKRIRSRYPEVGIVLMSAFAQEDDHGNNGSSLGCRRLTKPFEVGQLVDVLKKEEDRQNKRKICLLSEGGDSDRILDTLSGWGYRVSLFNSSRAFEAEWFGNNYSLFLLDGDMLNNGQWKILNTIDSQAPNSPIVIFSQNGGAQSVMQVSDMALTVLKKSMLLQADGQGRETLDRILEFRQ
jgi:DNA-binding NtrC family response regulator